jgi:predicted RNA-binding protein YlqC (UPF0109 family)
MSTKRCEQTRGFHSLHGSDRSGNVTYAGFGTDNDTMIATMSTADEVERLLRLVLPELLDYPEKITIEQRPLGYAVTQVVIKADASNMGGLLGRSKKHVVAFRCIARVLSGNADTGVQLIIEEQDGGAPKKRSFLPPDQNWNRGHVEEVFSQLFDAVFPRQSRVVIADDPSGASVVQVFLSNKANPATAHWLQMNLEPLVVSVLSKHRRFPGTLQIVRDQMLFEQAGGKSW